MTSPDKPKAKWGDLIALGVGAGLIAYLNRAARGVPTMGPHESVLEIVLGGSAIVLAICAVTYLILRAWDALMARLRRR
jgi:hypothetical protein